MSLSLPDPDISSMESSNRLVFSKPFPSLQNISAFRVALDLWTFKVQQVDSYEDDVISYFMSKKPMFDTNAADMLTVLPVPERVKKIIGSFFKVVNSEIRDWFDFHRTKAIFSKNKKINEAIMTEKHSSLVVWQPDGAIDYEKTARELVNNGDLNLFHRFDLICEYFMEDELRKARDVWFEMQNAESSIFMGTTVGLGHPTVVFFNSIVTKKVTDYSTNSIIEYLVNHARTRLYSSNYTSVKFAFDHIHTDDRIPFGIRIIEGAAVLEYQTPKLAAFLISKYTESEQYRLLLTSDLFIRLMRFFICSQEIHALETWLHVRNLVKGDQFLSMLNRIGHIKFSKYYKYPELLVELWRCSPLRLKKFIYELPDDNDFLYKFCIRPDYMHNYGSWLREDRILIEILTDAELEFRRKFWDRYWTHIVDHSQPNYLLKIMKLCLSKKEIEETQKGMKTSEVFLTYFKELIVNRQFPELNGFLDFVVCGEEHEITDFKRQLLEGIGIDHPASILENVLQSEFETDEHVDVEEEMKNLDKFLSEAYGEDVDGLAAIKIEIIAACITPSNLCERDNLIKIFQYAECLCDDPTLTKVKDTVLRTCKTILSKRQNPYDFPEEWSMLLMWCVGSGKKMLEFLYGNSC